MTPHLDRPSPPLLRAQTHLPRYPLRHHHHRPTPSPFFTNTTTLTNRTPNTASTIRKTNIPREDTLVAEALSFLRAVETQDRVERRERWVEEQRLKIRKEEEEEEGVDRGEGGEGDWEFVELVEGREEGGWNVV